MSIDNCDLRLWRPAPPATRPGSFARSPRTEQDPAEATTVVDPDGCADVRETAAAER